MRNQRNSIWLLIIILLLVGLFTGQAVFFSLAYLFSGLMTLSALWAWFAVRGVRIARRTRSRRAQVGRNFGETFSVRNASPLPKLWLEVRDHSDLPNYRASHVIPPLMPFRSYEWRASTTCTVRGEFQLGPMTIISGDPFGLFAPPRRIPASERIIVYPATVPISQFRLPMGMISGGEPQRYLSHNITTNASGVRDYVPGDSINRVHWKSTARRNQLIVKEFELDPLVDIWLFIDFSAESLVEESSVRRIGGTGAVISGSGAGIPESTEEYNVVIAASLATHFTEIERALGFVAYTPQREAFQPDRGHRQLTRILETLAVTRSLAPHSLREMLSLEMTTIKRGASLVMVTSSLKTDWISELQVLSRRGIRPMCIFVDPTSFGLIESTDAVRGALQLARIPTIIVRKGDNIGAVLAQRPF